MMHLLDLIVSPNSSLQTALERMTKNRKGLLFVCDDAHLVGVISDGDIRRALVGHALLIARVETYMNLDPIIAGSIGEGKQLLKNHNLLAVPVLDGEGMVVSAIVQGINQIEILSRKTEEVFAAGDGPGSGAIAVITARGGSKRIPRKNLALVGGKPLLAYAIEAAKDAEFISTVIVSTDDQEIADVALKLGAEVPWLRPSHLAQDNTPSIDVVVHAVDWARGQYGRQLQYGVLLEPTAPLRTSLQIDQAVEILKSSDADSVVSVCIVPHIFNPEELLVIQDLQLQPYIHERTLGNRYLRDRQTAAYFQNGLVYAFRLDMLLKKKSLYGEKCLPMVVDWDYFLDIDVPADLALAEYRMRQLR